MIQGKLQRDLIQLGLLSGQLIYNIFRIGPKPMFLPHSRQAQYYMQNHILLTIRQLKMKKYGNLCGHYAVTTLKRTAVAGGYLRLLLDPSKRDVSLSVVFSCPFHPVCLQPAHP